MGEIIFKITVFISKLAFLRSDLGNIIIMEQLLIALMLLFLTVGNSAVNAADSDALTVNISKQSSELRDKLAQGEAYRDSGSFELAENEFITVLSQAEKSGDKLTQVMASAALGYNYYLSRNDLKAQSLLERSNTLVKSVNSPRLAALIEDYLGMLFVSLNLPEKATVNFENALKNARLVSDNDLIAGIQVNQAQLEQDDLKHLNQLKAIKQDVLKLNNRQLKIKLLLNMGEQLFTIPTDKFVDSNRQELFKTSYDTLHQAYVLADADNEIRLRSQAEGYLARLYSNQDALDWLDKAISDAQQVNAIDLLMQWEKQSAEIFRAKGDYDAALKSYKRSVKWLADIRYGLPVNLHNGHSSIKEIIDPIYRGLADVLLLQASKTPDPENKEKLIKEAIDSMETIKQTELEDFFKDRCLIDEKTVTNLKDINLPGIGIIYPIILSDRLELLFKDGSNTHFEQKTVLVSSSEVVLTSTEMAQFLRQGQGNYRKASRKLYEWLLKPFDSELKEKGLTTLIYVPDGTLRKIPFSALLNGKTFAVEEYTIATLPGLNIKNAITNRDKKPKALIAALSKPDGASIDELLNYSANSGLTEGEQSLIKSHESQSTSSSTKITREALVDDLSLPAVNDEVKSLQKNIDNTTMLNQSFTSGGFKDSVSSRDYSIVHVASHGYFGKSADQSFVMAYDHTVKLGEFQSFLGYDKSNKNPIDLLTLSACQTAEGDDRALLGFSGMAIKTNALSAIGTLWSVNDDATAKFMDAFYSSMTKYSKAQALRQAQLYFLTKDELKHPHYWAPFIMVGNW